MRGHVCWAGLLASCVVLVGCEAKEANPAARSPAVASVTITPSTEFLKLKAQERYVLTAVLSNGETQQVTARWASDNISVATVDGTGLVSAVGVGTATITADYQGSRATRLVRVLPDYAGRWVGNFLVTSCQVSGAFQAGWCGQMLNRTFPVRLELVQTVTAVSGTWTLQDDATGNVTGNISPSGHLALTGSRFLGGVTTTISDWDTVTTDNLTMTGGFTLTWTASGGSGRTEVVLRDFGR